MRHASLFLLFLLLGSLLVVTAPVRAETAQYYALSFDGADDYISLQGENLENLDAVTVVVLAEVRGWGTLFSWGSHVHTKLRVSDGRIAFSVSNGSMYSVSTVWTHKVVSLGGRYLIVATADTATNSVKVLVNNETVLSDTLGVDVIESSKYHATKYIASVDGSSDFFAGKIYLVLIYTRALSDNEIAQIYENPLNPPRDGLVLEYLPSSVDTANNVWKDLSGQGNDGTIVGASYVPLRPISEEQLEEYARALEFNGSEYTITANSEGLNPKSLSVVTFFKIRRYPELATTVVRKGVSHASSGTQYMFYLTGSQKLYFYVSDGATWRVALSTYVDANATVMVSGVYSYNDGKAYLYLGNNLVSSATPGQFDILNTTGYLYIADKWAEYPFIDVYLVLIYNRALSDSEVRQIYENPLDPPKDGLVLFYSPYSYDLETGRWLNIAPIFPTIPLAEELDGVNYGAEPVRVSIPSLHIYDIENNSEIPISNVSVAILANNTTISLIPSLLTLPYNSTVTLNVSASGYSSRLLQIPTSITSIAVYLYPTPSRNNTTTPPNWTNNFTMPDVNGTGWSGWQIGKEALSLNFDKAIRLFFTQNPNSKAQVFLPFAIWLGMTVLGLVFSQSPLVALTLGTITQAGLAGLGAKLDMRLLPGVVTLYLFLFIWILKDFIESRKAD